MTQMMTHFSQCQRNNLLLKNPLNSPHNSVLSTMLLTPDTNNKLDHTTASSSNCVLTLWCWHQRANNPTELAPIELLAHCWWQEGPKGGSNRSCLGFEWTGSPFQYQNGYWDLLFWYCICQTQPIFTNTETAMLSRFEWPKTELTVMKWINLISKRSFGVRYVFGSEVSWGLPLRHVIFLDQGFCTPWTKRFE